MAAFNSMLHRAMSIPMTNEDRQAELNYIYKHSNRQRIRKITTLTQLDKEEKYVTLPYFPLDYQQVGQHIRQAACEVGFHKRKHTLKPAWAPKDA
jgi:hypothetical protein